MDRPADTGGETEDLDETELGIAKAGSWLLLDVSLAGEENSAMEFPPSTLLTGAEEAKEGSFSLRLALVVDAEGGKVSFIPILAMGVLCRVCWKFAEPKKGEAAGAMGEAARVVGTET